MRRLAVFARAPVAGRVKSRLSPALPASLAASLYAGLLGDTLDAVRGAQAATRLVYWADDAGPAARDFAARTQRGADLGARLQHAFAELLFEPGAHALIVGSDTPPLTTSHLNEALDALDTHDLVLGPTVDGGYWCIGLRQPAPGLFADIPWSTREVLTCTLVRAHGVGLRVATVATLDDLDTPQDLVLLAGALAAGAPACGSQARAALCAMGLLPATLG